MDMIYHVKLLFLIIELTVKISTGWISLRWYSYLIPKFSIPVVMEVFLSDVDKYG